MRRSTVGAVTVLGDHVDERSEAFQANRAHLLALLAEHDGQLALVNNGGGDKYVERHRQRGKLLCRERIELLVDRDSPFLELSPLAAWGSEFPVGASVVTGIGVVEGVECVIIANDPTVRGGTTNPYTLKKTLRALEIARANRLPLHLPRRVGRRRPAPPDRDLHPRRRRFPRPHPAVRRRHPHHRPRVRQLHRRRRLRAGHVRLRRDGRRSAKVFLGGPPLVKMATGEETDDEELGGAEMHARVSGLADHFAVDELDCIRIGRAIVRRLNWRKLGPPPRGAGPRRRATTPRSCSASRPADLRSPVRPARRARPRRRRLRLRRVQAAATARRSSPAGPSSTATRSASSPTHRGVLFNEEAKKATQFIQLANQTDTPLLFLQNTTGYMVGKDYEQRGMVKDGAKMINAVTNTTVPHLTVNIGGSLRRRQLRHVRPGLRAPLPVHLAQRQDGGDGPAAARRRAVDRRPPVGRVDGPRRSTRRPTPPCGPRSRSRSSASRSPCSSPARSTTTASSTPATPAPCSASPVGRPQQRGPRARDGFGVFRM